MSEEEKLDINKIEDLSTVPMEKLYEIVDADNFGKKQPPAQKQANAKTKKTFRSIAKDLLALHPPRELVKKINKLSPELNPEEIDVRVAMLQMQVYNALKGDAKAFELVRDTAGEKPQDNLNIESNAPIIQVSDSQIAMVINQINQLAGD